MSELRRKVGRSWVSVKAKVSKAVPRLFKPTPNLYAQRVSNTAEIQDKLAVSGAGGGGSGGDVSIVSPLTGGKVDVNASLEFPSDAEVSVKNFPGSVNVSNFPSNQRVSGSVSVSGNVQSNVVNWPAKQIVGGSVSVDNLPATQPVSGSVSVSNQPSSIKVSNSDSSPVPVKIVGGSAGGSSPFKSVLDGQFLTPNNSLVYTHTSNFFRVFSSTGATNLNIVGDNEQYLMLRFPVMNWRGATKRKVQWRGRIDFFCKEAVPVNVFAFMSGASAATLDIDDFPGSFVHIGLGYSVVALDTDDSVLHGIEWDTNSSSVSRARANLYPYLCFATHTSTAIIVTMTGNVAYV